MNYFICQEWSITKNNHAGMSHLCSLLKEKYPDEVAVKNVPYYEFKIIKHTRPFYHITYFFIAIEFLIKVKKDDNVFLMEYMHPYRNQKLIAKIIKLFKPDVKIFGLAHLTPLDMDRFYQSNTKLVSWTNKVDKVLTLGSSLTSYLKSRGASNVKTLFHYVDLDYFQPEKRASNTRLQAIIMGNMKRNTEDIGNIAKECSEIDFVYCKGNSVRDTTELEKLSNMKVLGFLPEDELKNVMNQSDISLNLMYDTIGSNVITSSMAIGLVMIVNDVGSIRDYCTEESAFLCKNTDEIIESLHYCANNRGVLKKYKQISRQNALKLSSENFYKLLVAL